MTDRPVGLLPVDKPEGRTSHDIVDDVRRALDVRRVGHTGTLDPFASGLLLLCVGWATRLAEYVVPLRKTYRGAICLGERTDTDDRTGRVIERTEAWRDLDGDRIRAAMSELIGTFEQRPPDFSAKKVQGRRAHRAARQGVGVALEPARVTVHRLHLVDLDLPRLHVVVECSSGTYVRALARDLGIGLGVGAHLAELRRERIGAFRVEDALAAEQMDGEAVRRALLPPRAAVEHLAQVETSPVQVRALRVGQAIPWPEPPGEGPLAILAAGQLAAIAQWGAGELQPRKVFPTADEH